MHTSLETILFRSGLFLGEGAPRNQELRSFLTTFLAYLVPPRAEMAFCRGKTFFPRHPIFLPHPMSVPFSRRATLLPRSPGFLVFFFSPPLPFGDFRYRYIELIAKLCLIFSEASKNTSRSKRILTESAYSCRARGLIIQYISRVQVINVRFYPIVAHAGGLNALSQDSSAHANYHAAI